MNDKDIRLYIYNMATLQKCKRAKQSFKSIEDCENFIKENDEVIRKWYCRYLNDYKNFQYVIVEYTGKLDSKIIKIIE